VKTLLLEIKNLHKKFGKLEVLNGVNISVEKGEKIVILGSSGSGKSTALRCVNLLETPTGGQILYNGEDITKQNVNKYRKKVGMVFQNFNLFPNMSVLENITLAPKAFGDDTAENIEKKAIELLKRVGLEDKKDAYPNSLSGGQKQRVAIGRALLSQPEILLMDEPLSALDLPRKRELLTYLENLTAQIRIPILYVTHSVDELVRLADRVVLFESGKTKLFNNLDEFLNSTEFTPWQAEYDSNLVR